MGKFDGKFGCIVIRLMGTSELDSAAMDVAEVCDEMGIFYTTLVDNY